jgi:hypothetical protein
MGKKRVLGSLHFDPCKKPCSWVSNVGATLPNGALPLTPENELQIVAALISDLNGLCNLGLGADPSVDLLCANVLPDFKPNILMIGASHVACEGAILSDRGCGVTIYSKPVWRPNRGLAEEMADKVNESHPWMRSSLELWMRSSLVVRASDCQCTCCNGPGFDPSIRRHSGI